MSKDYYNILGVDKATSQADIKKAFRKKAHEYHPDKKTGDETKFKEINEAYQILGNEEKKKQYDQFGATFDGSQGFGGASPFGQGFDFSQGFGGAQNVDFDLGDIFGSVFGGGRQGRTSNRGSDIEVDLSISLKEAVFGVGKDVSLRKNNSCKPCKGTGADKGSSYKDCNTCNGTGRVTTALGPFRTQTACHDCSGKGKSIDTKCGACSGNGYITENVDIKVEIPAGIDNGQSIRLAEQGNSGSTGGISGDLYVNIYVEEEKGFTRQGFDLSVEHPIPFSLAVLGGDTLINTIDGKVKLKIPAGTASNKQFILKGKGVTRLKSRGRGDQIVNINIDIPSKLNKKQKKLVEELNEELYKDSKFNWFK